MTIKIKNESMKLDNIVEKILGSKSKNKVKCDSKSKNLKLLCPRCGNAELLEKEVPANEWKFFKYMCPKCGWTGNSN
jgi:predicted RNA-binding Zn-ribbon protein involved in translation (DUF1610 family)